MRPMGAIWRWDEVLAKDKLEKEVLALIKERSDKQIKIDWQFSIEVARDKMNKHYQKVFADNIQLKKT